jgi:hypothetical protein
MTSQESLTSAHIDCDKTFRADPTFLKGKDPKQIVSPDEALREALFAAVSPHVDNVMYPNGTVRHAHAPARLHARGGPAKLSTHVPIVLFCFL